MGNLFSGTSKAQTPQYTTAQDPFGSLRTPTLNWLQSQIGQAGPKYGGEMVAPLTAEQNASIGKLNQFANQSTPAVISAASADVNKTLQGQGDPTASPYYQAVKAEAARNLADTQSNIAGNAAGAGNYYTGARVKEQGQAATDVAQSLNTLLGGLAQQDYQSALSQALPIGTAEQNLPLQQAGALQALGAQGQTQQQAIDTALQNAWQQSNYDYPLSIAQLIQPYATQQPTVAQTGYQQKPSLWSQIAPFLGTAASFIPGIGNIAGPIISASGNIGG